MPSFELVLAVWLLALASLACLPFVTPPDRRPTLAELLVAAALGMCTLGVLWVLERAMRPAAQRPIIATTACLVAACTTLARRRSRVIPSPWRPNWAVLPLMAVVAARLAPIVVGAVLMGAGPFPAVFFHVDTPFRLTHVIELAMPGGFPPASLLNVGTVAGNHFGAPAAAGAISSLLGLPAHRALFWIVLPLGAAAAVGVVWMIVAHLTRDRLLRGVLLLFVLAAWPWPSDSVVDEPLAALRQVVEIETEANKAWQNPETFRNHFEDVTEVFGRLLLLVSALPLAIPGGRSLAAGAAAVVLLGQVKTGDAVLAAILLAAAGTTEAIRTGRAFPFAVAAVASAGSLALMRVGGVGTSVEVAFEPFWMLRRFPELTASHALMVLVFGVLPVFPLLMGAPGSSWRHTGTRTAPFMLAIAGVYAFFEVFGAYSVPFEGVLGAESERRPMEAFVQPLQHVPALVALGAGIGIAGLWPFARRLTRGASLACLAALAILPTAHRAYGAWVMAVAPAFAHEYADNRAIAVALGAVPVAGSVVATNDLRYPAGGRDLRQFQIPAIWGHQAFAVPGYDRYPGWEDRVLLQWTLRESQAPCSGLRALAAAGVTHLLIHKAAPHAATLPLAKVHDDERYAVYRFDGLPACGAE